MPSKFDEDSNFEDEHSNLDTKEYADRAAAAEKALDAGEALTPRASSFGLFIYNGGRGPSFQYSVWFSSRRRLLDFLANHLTYLFTGVPGTDPFAIHASVERAVGKFRESPAHLRLLIPKLNLLLRGYSRIAWVGTLKELKEGNGRRERLLRLEFRHSMKSELGPRSIQSSEGVAFRDFIREHGFPETPVRTGLRSRRPINK